MDCCCGSKEGYPARGYCCFVNNADSATSSCCCVRKRWSASPKCSVRHRCHLVSSTTGWSCCYYLPDCWCTVEQCQTASGECSSLRSHQQTLLWSFDWRERFFGLHRQDDSLPLDFDHPNGASKLFDAHIISSIGCVQQKRFSLNLASRFWVDPTNL